MSDQEKTELELENAQLKQEIIHLQTKLALRYLSEAVGDGFSAVLAEIDGLKDALK